MPLPSYQTLCQPGASEGALVKKTMTEIVIVQTASFSCLLLSPALVIGDVLSVLYHWIVTSQLDGDPTVVTTLPDE